MSEPMIDPSTSNLLCMLKRSTMVSRFTAWTFLSTWIGIIQSLYAEQPAGPSAQADSALSRMTFSSAVKTALPSTVTIVSLRTLSREKQEKWDGFGEAQRRALNDLNQIMRVGDKWMEPTSHGSGFIVDATGHVVTNNHVVSGIDSAPDTTFAICIGNQSTWQPATLIGRDPSTDLAVLMTGIGKTLPVAWGESDAMQQGDLVLALGTPRDLELKQTATMGIVSATGRDIGGLRYQDFIQTDASINPGNSGGPLVNLKGEVIGVNQSIILGMVTSSDGSAAQSANGGPLRVDGNIGIGMAIPSSLARKVVAELIEHGRVRRGFLGVKLAENTSESEDHFGASLRVTDVLRDSPAEQAGILEGDDLLTFNGLTIASMRTFHLQVSLTEPGTKAAISLIRSGKPVNLEVAIADLSTTRYAAIGFDPTGQELPELEGVELQTTSNNLGDELIIAARVAQGSPASIAGLKAPSIIVAVAGVKVSTPQEFEAALATTVQGGYVLLTFREIRPRGLGKPIEVSVPVKEKSK